MVTGLANICASENSNTPQIPKITAAITNHFVRDRASGICVAGSDPAGGDVAADAEVTADEFAGRGRPESAFLLAAKMMILRNRFVVRETARHVIRVEHSAHERQFGIAAIMKPHRNESSSEGCRRRQPKNRR